VRIGLHRIDHGSLIMSMLVAGLPYVFQENT